MDSKEYIASGIIERYVLGLVSPQEKQEVECMSHIYPEIGDELSKFQVSIEKMALKGAVEPPSRVKDRLMEQIKTEKQKTITSPEAKIIEMTSPKSGFYKYAAAASVMLIVGLGIGLYSLSLSKANLKTEMATFTKEKDSIQKQMDKELSIAAANIHFLKDTNTMKCTMKGTEMHPNLMATVYWNTKNKKVMLEANLLDTPPADKQYQLWAIVDGQPKDMGVFGMDNSITLHEMKLTSSAQAFAVTLEPIGGSTIPSMDQMYVLGTM